MPKYLYFVLASVMLWSTTLCADTDNDGILGRIADISSDHLMMDTQRYEVIYPATDKGREDAEALGFETEVWVAQPRGKYRIDYITLIHVGYADRARITLEKGVVRTIEILDLQQ